jgi:hypothetical protein
VRESLSMVRPSFGRKTERSITSTPIYVCDIEKDYSDFLPRPLEESILGAGFFARSIRSLQEPQMKACALPS